MTTQEVLTTHRQVFYNALLTLDFNALSKLYSDDYVLVRPDGSVLNKAEVLSDLREGGLTFTSIELTGEEVKIFGQVAILTGESRATAVRKGTESSAHFRLIAVYTSTTEGLKLVHFQSTSIPEKTNPFLKV
jgi:ketosteroid isomerase-like protein